ncbi:MAG TPA: hypothetical protein VJQ54_02645, partial [Candidatus Sulfotelmatobacter sp.]|nr:hypothetical protein [Candidatus Sulfotelmatobacter sp.]
MILPVRRRGLSRIRIVSFAGAVLALAILPGAPCRAQTDSDAPQGRLITSLAVAVNPSTHKVYAVDEGANSVLVMNERTGSIRTVKVGSAPISLAVNRKTNRIYVVNTDSGAVSVIDGNRDEVIATVKGGVHPYAVAINET